MEYYARLMFEVTYGRRDEAATRARARRGVTVGRLQSERRPSPAMPRPSAALHDDGGCSVNLPSHDWS